MSRRQNIFKRLVALGHHPDDIVGLFRRCQERSFMLAAMLTTPHPISEWESPLERRLDREEAR